MKKLLLSLFIFTSNLILAQGEASKWYFGNFAGLDFSSGTPTALTNMPTNYSNLNSEEGCTTISNSAGELLFYTNGKIVWTKNHTIMANGTELGGDQSSTQSAIIVPAPETPNIYYIFTVDEHNYNRQGLSYSIVDMSLNNGLGAVTTKNVNLLAKCAEKITAVKSNNCNEFWVIAYGNQNANTTNNLNAFFAFKITPEGVNPNYVRSIFNENAGLRDGRGYLKVSADGSKIAIAHQGLYERGLILYDFNNSTGIVSNAQPLYPQDDSTGYYYNAQPYGVEFSLSGRFLYTTFTMNNNDTDAILMQYDLQDNNSGRLVSRDVTFRGALQMAPDGKIYRSLSESYDLGSKYIGVIQNPESLGTAANYLHNAIDIDPNNQNRRSRQGLPPFIQSMFLGVVNIINPDSATIETSLKLCEGQSHTLTAPQYNLATYTWYKDGVVVAQGSTRTLTVNLTGLYKLEINTPEFSCPIKGEARVDIPNNPQIDQQPNNLILCGITSLQNLGINFQQQTQNILGNQSTTDFEVKYFYTLADAQANTNAINLPLNTVNSYGDLTLFARVHAVLNNNCFLIADSFNLTISNGGANIPDLPNVSLCAASSDNLSVNITASEVINQLFQNIDISNFEITLHNSSTEAANKTNALNLITYTGQTLYVSVQDISTPICIRVIPATLNINQRPIVPINNVEQCGIGNQVSYNFEALKQRVQNINPNYSVNFYSNESQLLNQTNALQSIVLEQNNTTIFYQIIDNQTGCTYNSQFTIVKNLIYNSQEYTICTTANATTYNYNLQDLNFTEGNFYTNLQDAYNNTNALQNLQVVLNTNTVLYYKVMDQLNCTNLQEIRFLLSPVANVSAQQNVSICTNLNNSLEINSGVALNLQNNYTYLWSTGETTPTLVVTQSGEYTVTVTNANGCSTTSTVNVREYQIPSVRDILISDFSENNSVQVVMSNYTNLEYSLDGVNYQDSTLFTNVKPGIYTLTIRDIDGCNTYQQEISVLGVPNFFTPNADGINDTWNMHGISNNHYPNTQIQIFDRYGKLLKSFKPATDHWDGTYNNKPLPSTDYWYIITLDNGKTYKSNFSLKR